MSYLLAPMSEALRQTSGDYVSACILCTDKERLAYLLFLKFRLYKPLADTWSFYDNSVAGSPRLLASGGKEISTSIENRLIWKHIQEEHNG